VDALLFMARRPHHHTPTLLISLPLSITVLHLSHTLSGHYVTFRVTFSLSSLSCCHRLSLSSFRKFVSCCITDFVFVVPFFFFFFGSGADGHLYVLLRTRTRKGSAGLLLQHHCHISFFLALE